MGNWFGIDSCSSTDTLINNIVFSPPDPYTKNQLFCLEKHSNNKIKILSFTTKNNIRIYGIQFNSDSLIDKNKIIIYSHGNGEDIYQCNSLIKNISNTFNIDVVTYDYPGYGISESVPSEMGCYDALDAVIEHYKKLGKIIILVGRSLGSGISIECAVRQKDWNYPIILISAYKSIPRVAFDYPIESTIKKYKFSSIYKINKLECPVKLIHGSNDTLIPVSHSEDLYDNLKNKKFNLTRVNGAGHNDIFTYNDFFEGFNEVLQCV